jgi:2-C-methyl-D-erythritol 4-phosphate cytidylyltransferase
VLLQALRQARGPATDEASAIEQLGLKPRLVQGSRDNLKVTWPEDLALAEAILKRRS